MNKMIAIVVILAVAFIAMPVLAKEPCSCHHRDCMGNIVPNKTEAPACKMNCQNKTSKAYITDTPSIKAMQSQKAPNISVQKDVIDETVPTQTDNTNNPNFRK